MAKVIGKAVRNGRTWTIQQVSWSEADDVDFEFWYGMSPADRVMATEEALEICLRARGMKGVPGLRRVYRLVNRKGARK